jgi:hypothetical protein
MGQQRIPRKEYQEKKEAAAYKKFNSKKFDG